MKIIGLIFLSHIALMPAWAQQVIPLYPAGSIPYNLPLTAKGHPQPTIGQNGFETKVGVPFVVYYPPTGAPNGGAVLICPGGSYQFVSAEGEGAVPAKLMTKFGYAAFVLHYRLPDPELVENENRRLVPLADAIQGMNVIKANAATLGLDTNRIGVMGFSAGGHLAGSLATIADKHPMGQKSDKPAWTVLIYPVLSMYQGHEPSRQNLLGGGRRISAVMDTLFSPCLNVGKDTPPAFLLHTTDDDVVPYSNSVRYIEALRTKGVAADMHIYAKGGHGFGVSGPAGWTDLLAQWLKGR